MKLTYFGIGTKQIQISTMYLYILGRVYPRFISALTMVGVGAQQVTTWTKAIGSCPGTQVQIMAWKNTGATPLCTPVPYGFSGKGVQTNSCIAKVLQRLTATILSANTRT